MQYISLDWAVWMVATFSLYWLATGRWRQWVLVALTAGFVGYLSPISAAILLAFTAVTSWLVARRSLSGMQVWGATLMFAAVLVFYKAGARGQPIEVIITEGLIPLGLSYYTFRCLHLIYEKYRGRFIEVPTREIVGYLFFLPTIVVGPIHRFDDYQRDRYRVRLDASDLRTGLERILYGYVKIGFLGNHLVTGKGGALIAALPPEDAAMAAYLWIVQGGLNLYFQFSGFADIAIGFSRLLGFRIIENFNWPYLKTNLSDYWRSWHISLTGWCRDYVYTAVVSASRSPALGALATLIVIGLWHELSLRFICWGVYHGIGLIAWQRFQELKPRLPSIESPLARRGLTALSVLFTIHYVWFGFVIVRTTSLSETFTIWKTATLGFIL